MEHVRREWALAEGSGKEVWVDVVRALGEDAAVGVRVRNTDKQVEEVQMSNMTT